MTLSCKVAEKVRAELYVNNPKLFADIAGMSATKYRSDLETQLGKIDDQISDLGLEVSKSGTLGTIEVLYNILEFEVAKYALTMCLVPDVTVTKFSCVIGLLGTIKGGRDILTGDISRNAQLERVEELRKALRKERQRFESVRQKIVAASLDEAEKRTEATFYRLCRQIETSCLR